MGSYIQMGHHSRNLLDENDLSLFSGAILSPVNETKESLAKQIRGFQKDSFEMIFDPQLYYPNSDRGHLPNWDYFPNDFDTADHSSQTWWNALNESIYSLAHEIKPSSLCSPAYVPKNYTDSYYEMNNWIAENLKQKIQEENIDILLTSIVRLSDLTAPNRSAEIASLLSSGVLNRIYLVLLSDVEPRRELRDTDELKGAMRLISYLKSAGISVLIGFCSTDTILWKTAGAKNCASGKYFNLRRFTPSRWEPPARGGGQLSYWTEESIMAYLREPDLARLRNFRSLDITKHPNTFSDQILATIDEGLGNPWLALSWKQYLYWFSDFERRCEKVDFDTNQLLKDAEAVWRELDDNDILFDEINNDGSWIRRWRKAVVEFQNETR